MAKGKRPGATPPSTPPRRMQGPMSSIQCSECGKSVRRPRAQKGPAGEKTCCSECFEGLQQHFVPLQQAQLNQAVSWADQAVKAAVRLRSNVGYLLTQQLARDAEYLGPDPFTADDEQDPQQKQQQQHAADKAPAAAALPDALQQQANTGASAATEAGASGAAAAAATRGSPSPVATPNGVAPGSLAASDGTASGSSSSGITQADGSRASPACDTAAAATTVAPAADAATAAAVDPAAQDPEWQAYAARQAVSGFQEVYYHGDTSLERNLGDAYDPPLPGCWGMAALAGVGAVVQEAECMRNEGPAAYRQLLPDASLGQLESLPRPAATANQLYSARAALERFLMVVSSIAKDDPTRFTASQVAGALHSSGPLPLRQPVPRALPEEAWEQQQAALAAAQGGMAGVQPGPRGGAGRSSRNSSPAPRGPSPGPHVDLGFNLAAVPRGKRTQAARGVSPAGLPPVLSAAGAPGAPPMGSRPGGVVPTSAPYSSAWAAAAQQDRKRPREEVSPAVGPATTAAIPGAMLGGGYNLPPPAFDLPPAALAGINTMVNGAGVGWTKAAAQQQQAQQQQQQQQQQAAAAGRRSSGYLWGMPVGLPPGTARYSSWFDQQAPGVAPPQQYSQQAPGLAGLYNRYGQAPALHQQQQFDSNVTVTRPIGRLTGHPAQLPPMSLANTAPPPVVGLPVGNGTGGAGSARGLSSPIKSRLVGGGPLVGGCGSAFAPVGTIFSAAECLRAQAAAAAGSSGAGFAEDEGPQQYVHSSCAPSGGYQQLQYGHPQLPQAYDMPAAGAASARGGAAGPAGDMLPPATAFAGVPRRSSDSGVWEGVAGGPSKRPRQVPVGFGQ